jgi:ribosomal protein S18 acetylase RimI-like enzyme
MDPWQRAIAFMRRVDERGAEEVRHFTWGRVLINQRLNLVHDANYVLVDHAEGASAGDLVELAERAQADLGLVHRRVNLDDRAAADQMLNDFLARGYLAERFSIMVQRRDAGPNPKPASIHEVTWERVRRARKRQLEHETWATPEVIEQLLSRYEMISRRMRTRYFAALADGEVVSSCELRTEDGSAQIETVETLPEFRNRGLARAVLSAALEAARGSDFVFLVADNDDWPQQLYRKLGFQDIGLETRFLRRLV